MNSHFTPVWCALIVILIAAALIRVAGEFLAGAILGRSRRPPW
jgi:hypothetical protein